MRISARSNCSGLVFVHLSRFNDSMVRKRLERRSFVSYACGMAVDRTDLGQALLALVLALGSDAHLSGGAFVVAAGSSVDMEIIRSMAFDAEFRSFSDRCEVGCFIVVDIVSRSEISQIFFFDHQIRPWSTHDRSRRRKKKENRSSRQHCGSD